MAITSANRYLSRAEMEGNAEFIAGFFYGNGWTISAVAAMLGNMEIESTINPGIYESLDDTSSTNGFGLVQWTPNTKYKEWASFHGYGTDYANIEGQVARIQYELDNGLQWIATNKYNMSFEEFSKSTSTPQYLAQVFLYNYERPSDLNQPHRSQLAVKWYDFLIKLNIGSGQAITTSNMSKLLLYFGGTKRR